VKPASAVTNGESRFESDAQRYADFLATPEGRLRSDLTFANLREFLPAWDQSQSLRALDLGCGTGDTAVRLARLGFSATLFDSSPAMLELARRAVIEGEVTDRTAIECGDAARLADIFPAKSFDIVLCHNVLEFVDDPGAILRNAAGLMRGPSAILSVLVRNRLGEVLKAALQAGDLEKAEHNLSAEWGQESLYGGKVRLFSAEAVGTMLNEAGLRVSARRGVRILSDYLPEKVSRSEDYERIFSFEQKLSRKQEFFGIARYMQFLAQPFPKRVE
jgi:S-adenosylmethionine-dependent methyltransferase